MKSDIKYIISRTTITISLEQKCILKSTCWVEALLFCHHKGQAQDENTSINQLGFAYLE
jgi:hypothetical protein